MWIGQAGNIYIGDCRDGDRKATDDEIAAWKVKTAPDYRALRQYPPICEFDKIADWMAACDAVNAKYPKA